MRLMDCPKPLPLAEAFQDGVTGWTDSGTVLESVWADCGENGLFARDEFETVTALRQMEFITPEEVAAYVVSELQGHPTGRDIMAALDASTAGPTYQAGLLRSAAIERLDALEREHGLRSVAFEMLGPPRLTKLLYEAFVLSRLCDSVGALAESDAGDLAKRAAELIAQDAELRSTVVSVGLPVVVPGGKVYRGELVIIQPDDGDIEPAVARGWVDVRTENFEVWIGRAKLMMEQAGQRDRRTDSGVDWGGIEPDDAIAPSRFATWIFRYEDGGERIKR